MYNLVIPRTVEKQLNRIPHPHRTRILSRLQQLQTDPHARETLKLAGKTDEYRIHAGNYRIRYQIEDDSQSVILLHCLHRKDIYRK